MDGASPHLPSHDATRGIPSDHGECGLDGRTRQERNHNVEEWDGDGTDGMLDPLEIIRLRRDC